MAPPAATSAAAAWTSGSSDAASFLLTKHSWKGKYKRIFCIGPDGVSTLNPSSNENTNQWAWSDVLSVTPTSGSCPPPTATTDTSGSPPSHALEFQLVFRKGAKKSDYMRFSSEFRSKVLTEALKHQEKFAERPILSPKTWPSFKYHWSEQRVQVLLEAGPHALLQRDPKSRNILASHYYKDVAQIFEVQDYPGGFVIQDALFGRLHLFASEARSDIIQTVMAHASNFIGISLEKPRAIPFEKFTAAKFGRFSADLHHTSLSEFTVYKQSRRRNEPVRRVFCLSETCIVERDPATYSVVSLRPLSSVAALVYNVQNAQLFLVQFTTGESRSYTSTERDSLLASFLDGVRGAGNRDVHVRMAPLEPAKRLGPLDCKTEEEVESSHLRFLVTQPTGWTFPEAVSRFNANVSYSGLTHAVTQEHLFAENKEKLILSALNAFLNRDISEVERMPIDELEQQFHALRRLVASKAGYAAFTTLVGFREKIGTRVSRALKLGHDGISHAAIDMICALMEPMHENYDLRQEQLNKSSLLSSEKFLDGLLDMWTLHVNRGTGALIVAAMLDFLTFALCAPYSETTDGKQFDTLLEKVAARGRTLYRLFQQPSHTITKGAGLVMKAIIEEGSEEVGHKMQLLALAEGALPIHLLMALFTKSTDNRLLVSCQLSRHLVGLWTAENERAAELLKRIFPSGLLHYLESDDATPTRDVDRLHVRDNLKMAISDAELNKGSALMLAAGRGLRTAKQTAAKTAEAVTEKTMKYTEEAWKVAEKQMEVAMQHWRTKMGSEWMQGGGRSGAGAEGRTPAEGLRFGASKNVERPIVLRKRRQRIKSKLNWPLFYFMFDQDHAKPNLIWNLKTRQELKVSLETEIQTFVQDRELSGGALMSWNFTEFEVAYNSLADEIKIGDYFLRLLLEEEQASDMASAIIGSSDFFNDLYHRFLLTPKMEMKSLCLQAMTIVYGRHYGEIGAFHDTKYIVAMLERTSDRIERDRLLLFINKLILHRENAHDFAQANGIRILVDLLPLAHLHTSRAVVNQLSTAIEVNPEAAKNLQEKEWYYGNADKERNGPVSFDELSKLYEDKEINPKTKVWAQGLEGWRFLHQVPQLKWALTAKGQPVMNESEMASLILGIFVNVCRYYPARDEDGAIIRPVPRVKLALSDPANLPHIVQLLLTFDPMIVEKVASLMHLVLEDNARLSTLYLTGCFFFVLMYTGSNLLPIGRFLAMSHKRQAFRSEDKEASAISSRSIVAQMLPDAMVAYLDNHGPDKFAEIFLGEFDTPEAIWNNEMRQFMIQKIAYHLADFTPRLKSNVRALYQYCPIPHISYPPLERELFCDIYYLRNLCNTAKFPDWPVLNPLNLLREVLAAWRIEVEKKPSSMTARDALAVLGLGAEGKAVEPEDSVIRKAYFRLAQQYHPDKNPKGRDMFERVNAAYEFLCSRAAKGTDGPDPDNIVLILRTQSILFGRYSNELHPYKYAGYPMLIKTIRFETADEKLFSKSAPLLAAASECAYFTVKCSALNAEEMRRENGLEVLYQAFERCVSVLSQSSKPDDVATQVCMHIIRFFSVASMFKSCRERMVEMPELVRNICRVFYYKQLTALCSVAAECVAALSVDAILQMHLLQAGALWHLLLFFFDYDYTLEEGGVNADEATSQQAVANKLAKLAVRACARMAGLLPPESPSSAKVNGNADGDDVAPKNPVIEECLASMITPHIVSRMRADEVEEVLKLLNSNSENPYMVWDNGTRAELTEFLDSERTSSIRTGTCDPSFGAGFKFSAHQDELLVGGVFIRIYNLQPMFQLKEPKKFAIDLLECLTGEAQYLYSLISITANQKQAPGDRLKRSEMSLEALANVIKHNKGVEIQCIGHFKLLFYMLRMDSYPAIEEMALRVLSNVTGSAECVDDIAASRVLAFLVQVVYGLQSQQALALGVLHNLMGDTRLVKECLSNGGIICLVYLFCTSQDQAIRERAADVVCKMSADKLMGPKVRIAMSKFLPEIFLDAMKKAPETGVQMYEMDHENPELIWNDTSRKKIKLFMNDLVARHCQHLRSSPDSPWVYDENEFRTGPDDTELVVSGIYLRLFNANPSWVLRKPREFMAELMENIVQSINSRGPQDLQRLETMTTSLVMLLASQPPLAEIVPATGYISRIYSVMGSLDESVVKAPLLVVNELARSAVCVESMASINGCIPPLKRAMNLRKDLVKVSCELFGNLFQHHHDNLVKQALDCSLVEDLLSHLDSPHTDYEARALTVKALKNMQCSLAYGEHVANILRQSSVWKQFEQQKHDLFITNQGGMGGFLTAATPGVAGYLTTTSGQAKSTPSMPPPMEENKSNPILNNPLL